NAGLDLPIASTPCPAEPDGADRLARLSAVGPRDSGHGERDVPAQRFERANRHLACNFFTDGAVRGERRRQNAEQGLLQRIAVRDDTAQVPIGAARNVRHDLADPAARTRFGAHEPPFGFAQMRAYPCRQRRKLAVSDHATRVALAHARVKTARFEGSGWGVGRGAWGVERSEHDECSSSRRICDEWVDTGTIRRSVSNPSPKPRAPSPQ